MKNKEMYVLLELVEEQPMTRTETEDFVMDYTNTIDIELEDIRLERFVGTRFFRAPASLYFSIKAIMEEGDEPGLPNDYWAEPGQDCSGDRDRR